MAPEMLGSEQDEQTVDERTDVYLLGSTLHYLLTSEPRHVGDTVKELVASVVESRPSAYDPAIAPTLAALANRATARDPSDRPATALEFRDGLREYLRHRSSINLTERASASLEEAVALRSGSPKDPAALTRARTLLLASRVALDEALREWQGNARARTDRKRALLEMFAIEIHDRHPGAARAVFAEIEEPEPSVRETLERLEAETAAEEQERLEARLRSHNAIARCSF
jgi:hypothetical protein